MYVGRLGAAHGETKMKRLAQGAHQSSQGQSGLRIMVQSFMHSAADGHQQDLLGTRLCCWRHLNQARQVSSRSSRQGSPNKAYPCKVEGPLCMLMRTDCRTSLQLEEAAVAPGLATPKAVRALAGRRTHRRR